MDISIKEVLTHLHRISGTGQAEPWGGQIGPIKRPPLMNAVQNALCEAFKGTWIGCLPWKVKILHNPRASDYFFNWLNHISRSLKPLLNSKRLGVYITKQSTEQWAKNRVRKIVFKLLLLLHLLLSLDMLEFYVNAKIH